MNQEMNSIFKHSGKLRVNLYLIFKGFGKDPFANDPFFNKGNPFQHMEKMIDKMRSEMHKPVAFEDFANGPG